MEKYLNRQQAGRVLARQLLPFANRSDVIVLALPRGGVPVAYEIATELKVPLDVFIVRKLGFPGHEELAMGAIAMGGITIFNNEMMREHRVSKDNVDKIISREKEELKRREKEYRGNRTFPNIRGKIVILVDDGIATGATMRVAVKALRQLKPSSIIVAVPVAENTISQEIGTLVDKLICPLRPTAFYAVGYWYETFEQTTDQEVKNLLEFFPNPGSVFS